MLSRFTHSHSSTLVQTAEPPPPPASRQLSPACAHVQTTPALVRIACGRLYLERPCAPSRPPAAKADLEYSSRKAHADRATVKLVSSSHPLSPSSYTSRASLTLFACPSPRRDLSLRSRRWLCCRCLCASCTPQIYRRSYSKTAGHFCTCPAGPTCRFAHTFEEFGPALPYSFASGSVCSSCLRHGAQHFFFNAVFNSVNT